MTLSTRFSAPTAPDGYNRPALPTPCGHQIGFLSRRFGLFSPIHKPYYNYYRLNVIQP